MRLSSFSDFLNEEYLRDFWGGGRNPKKASLYKNPRSVRKMSSWIRALSTIDGDFFCCRS